MGVIIEHIEYYLPSKLVSNEDILLEHPDWDMAKVAEKTGVFKRHIAGKEETACDLAIAACSQLFEKIDKEKIDAIIFCTQSPDYIMPPNAYLIHRHFAFRENIIAFDINQACSGYVYGLLLSRSLIISGAANRVLLITADTYSKYLHPDDRSVQTLFGDGAAASLITKGQKQGIVDILVASSGYDYKSFYIPSGGNRMPENELDKCIQMNGPAVLSFFRSRVPVQIRELLNKNNLSIDNIDLFVFHQASKIGLDAITNALKIVRNKVYSNIESTGNLVSASIPVALKMALDDGRIKKGNKIVLSGFGVGLSWASALIEF
jgi:3-oxoacyl-[acyl-carrier-protein] synthase-3